MSKLCEGENNTFQKCQMWNEAKENFIKWYKFRKYTVFEISTA